MTADAYSATAVRRSLAGLLLGKGVSAASTFLLFALLARLLPLGQYGAYIAIVAIMELGIAFGSFGLDWLTVRYVPECRVAGSGKQLTTLIAQLAILQLVGFTIVTVILYFSAAKVSRVAGLDNEVQVIKLYCLILLLEGCARAVRDHYLGGLLLQWRAQSAQIVRNLFFIGLLIGGAVTRSGAVTVAHVARIELLAVCASLLVSISFLLHFLIHNHTSNSEKNWLPPQQKEMFTLAWHTYLGYLMSLAYGNQIISLILSSVAGREMVAGYGFCRNLTEQIRRYLPADLFLGIVRPTLVARYSGEGGFASLNYGAQVVLCLSLFVLTPVFVCTTVYGDLINLALGGGKFASAIRLLPLFMFVLAFVSHRRVVEMVANTVSMSFLVVRAGAWLVAMPVLVLFVLWVGLDLEAVIMVSLLGEAMFNALVYYGLRNAGFRYTLPWTQMAKIFIVGLITLILVQFTPQIFPGYAGVGFALAWTLLVFYLAAIVIKPFGSAYQETINRLIGHRLFLF